MSSTVNDIVNRLFAPNPSGKMLGEIITWNCANMTIGHHELIDALRTCELEESVARELAPRHAFARACKKLSEARIIRQVAEDDETITFQFTSESRAEDHFEYTLETMLYLDKGSGNVRCALPGLAALAQEELDRCLAVRTGSDVTRIIQRLFERKADLFPIREQGGCYFCPQAHIEFLERIERFVNRLNGRMRRFPIPAGTPHGDRSVKEAVASRLESLIAEHQTAIAGFGDDTRQATLERAAERIRLTRHKIESYACYLMDEKERLERELALAATQLKRRIGELGSGERNGVPVAAGA